MHYTPITTSDAINPRPAKAVRLPHLPFSIPYATHDETAPRSMPVRRGYQPAPTMGPLTMRLFQYAESQGWKCTINQACDDLGIKTSSARSLAIKAGFIHLFKGYHAKPTLRERPNDNAMLGAMGGHAMGFDVDINLLPLDRLIK